MVKQARARLRGARLDEAQVPRGHVGVQGQLELAHAPASAPLPKQRAGGGYDFDTLADDLAAVLAALDLRAVTLVAHSLGGAEAVRMLARHGAGSVARLVLVGTTTPGPPPEQRPDAEALETLVGGLRVDRPAYVRSSRGSRRLGSCLTPGSRSTQARPHGLPLTHAERVASDVSRLRRQW